MLAAALLTVISFSGLFVGTAVGFLVSAGLVLSCVLPGVGGARESFGERTVKGFGRICVRRGCGLSSGSTWRRRRVGRWCW
ncbi:hypothetical protein ACFQV2_11815 [Actinokineospora soli]|uniref:Uncharacterized protein n=1 Tax=Actinokineospora soli TaxID=1048753 RepID=A0ABW2TKS7_9PSEU